jgi:flagellar biosynthetic protein FlhB
MSDEQDESSKTEEPTQKRLDDAVQKGDVARSQEIGHWAMFFAGAMGLMIFTAPAMRKVASSLMPFLEQPHLIAMDQGGLVLLLERVLGAVGLAVLPLFGLVVAFALAGSLVQSLPTISTEKITPDLSRISPMAGIKRLFSAQSLVEFLKTMGKVSIVGIVATYAVWPKRDWLPQLISMDALSLMGVVAQLSLLLLSGVMGVMTFVAGADFIWQKLSRRKRLRMSRQELRDEAKQSEGDPTVKARQRGLRMERAKRRMMAMVPKADVIVVNPTHYAVALQYDSLSMAAPRVVAKGVDDVAARIRDLARKSDVPIVENPPLARALYTVDLDSEVPLEHYKAVAEIIGYVMRLKGKMPGKAVPPRPVN